MKKILLCPNPARDVGLEVCNKVADIARASGFNVCVHEVTNFNERDFFTDDELSDAVLAVSFGGDGTVLRVSRMLVQTGIPLIGVNMGGKGFLAELEEPEIDRIPDIAKGAYIPENRLFLDIRFMSGNTVIERDFAINDCVIGGVFKVVDLTVYGDGNKISRTTGDGVIIAAPTGSTAYSLSAGGPIVEPTARNIIVTPICAHALGAKSFVLSEDRVVTVENSGSKRNDIYVSIDGRNPKEIPSEVSLEIRASNNYAVFAHLYDKDFYDRVSMKLGEKK